MDETMVFQTPPHVAETLKRFCKVTGRTVDEYLSESLPITLEADIDGISEWVKCDPLTIELDPRTHTWIMWWYEVLKKRHFYDGIDDFIKSCVRTKIDEYDNIVTEEDQARLDEMYEAAGVADYTEIKTQLYEILGKKP